MAAWSSEGENSEIIGVPACKAPTRNFRCEMHIVNQFDSGFKVACEVDGVMCMSLKDAKDCFDKRISELFAKWEEAKLKL